MRKQSGFTLVEVIVALSILAVLSLLTSQAIQSGLRNREWISGELNRESQVSDAMRVIRDDVTNAYHHRDIAIAMYNEIITATPTPANQNPNQQNQQDQQNPLQQPQSQQQNQTNQQNPQATPRPTPPQVTGFVGDSASLYFTTLTNARVLKDVRESDQAKVGYFVKSCRSRTARSREAAASKCLYRSTSPYLDEDVTKAGPETVLLEHVEEFKLRYLGPGKEDYVEEWKTGTNSSDQDTKENFPYAVEVTLSAHDKGDKKAKAVTMSALFPIRFPNNPPKKPGQQKDNIQVNE